MKYMGSKNRYTKYILPLVLKNRVENQWYVEPFVGGFNIIDKVEGNRLASDSHYYLIELFEAIQKGWTPPDSLNENEYIKIREHKNVYLPALVGFVGFGCSYAGKWFGGYARGNNSTGQPRDYCAESKRNILKQAERIKNIVIKNKNYLDLEIPLNSIIYCDPPYANCTKYGSKFDSKIFWRWCRTKAQEGHNVFISEYNAPKDFEVLWSKPVYNTLVKNTGANFGTEKLFRYRSSIE